MMNSVLVNTYVASTGKTFLAEVLAKKLTDDEVIAALYQRTLARPPRPRELDTCRRFLRRLGDRREAFEEAGVVGAVAKRPIGSFSYEKRLKNGAVVVCAVRVFALEVSRQSKRWPEKQERVVKWLSAAQAAQRVKEPNLGEIIRRMARRYDGHQPALAARTRARTKIK